MTNEDRTTPMPTGGEGPRSEGSAAEWPIGLVPLGWPDPTGDLNGFFAEVERLGFEGIQHGPAGGHPDATRRALADHGVRVAERYFAIPCTPDGPAEGAFERGLACLDDLDALAGEVLVAAIDGSPDRDASAARAESGPGLSDAGWSRLASLLEQLVEVAGERGHIVSFHPHAGTYVETEAETDRLMASVDADGLTLCMDTGHWIVGGGDPVATIRRYGRRVSHVHLKDVDAAVLARLQRSELDGLTQAVEQHVFCTLGHGELQLRAVLRELADAGYRGWLMIEQDSFPGSAMAAAAANRAALATALEAEGEPTVDDPSEDL
jgi:inosose dehydratase